MRLFWCLFQRPLKGTESFQCDRHFSQGFTGYRFNELAARTTAF
jgi:hypothetical protein